jgi:hypothetical protein
VSNQSGKLEAVNPIIKECKVIIRAACNSFSGAVLLLASGAQAQNLFLSSDAIYEYTPGGVQSTFASGLSYPYGLAFDSAGNLYVSSLGSGSIYKFTPGGVQSTFVTGLNNPLGLAFNSAGDLFEADSGSDSIYEYTPGGVQSPFASGLNAATIALAFEPVPEPSVFGLLAVGATGLLVRCRRKRTT